MKHTPLPFRRGGRAFSSEKSGFNLVGSDGQGFAFTVGLDPETDNANADFVVRACNSHYDLLDLLKASEVMFYSPKDSDEEQSSFLKSIKLAIAKAEGK